MKLKNEECDCCSYPGEVTEYTEAMTENGHKTLRLCEICAGTHLAVAIKYPSQCPDIKLYKSVAQLGNMILEEIRNLKG